MPVNDEFVRRLGHDFRDPALLDRALRHRSARRASGDDNERLEFLGDALLGFIIGEELFDQQPAIDEARLSVMRSRLVRRETLAALARELDVASVLQVGKGERRAGVADRDSVLADTVEALLAAVYLDAGMDRARSLILELFASRLQQVVQTGGERDAKSRLQEWLQARSRALPSYATVCRAGTEGEYIYHVVCRVESAGAAGAGSAECVASSRDVRLAEQDAAALMLARLRETP